MKLVNFKSRADGRVGFGELLEDQIADLSRLGYDLVSIAIGGTDGRAEARRASSSAPRIPLPEVTLDAPVLRPPKFLGIGLNYAEHVRELGMERPEHQVWFNKQSTCVIGPGAPIVVPDVSSMVDYEGELGVVIGRRCRHVPKEDARSVVAGYTIVNDVSVRDWQWRSQTWTLGKSFDTHGPMGPCLVTADAIPEPHGLSLRTWVNDELRQEARTDEMIFDIWEMIALLSTVFTLEPGDVLATGTPSGVGSGFDPPKWLKNDDIVRIEIEGIGLLENSVTTAPEIPDSTPSLTNFAN